MKFMARGMMFLLTLQAFCLFASDGCIPWEVRDGGQLFVTGEVDFVEVEIPDGVMRIMQNSFEGCESIERVHFPESLVGIHSCAFAFCANLKELYLPDSVTEIYSAAFADCLSLSSVKLPDDLGEIAKEVFAGCSSLKEIVLPASITNISDKAFANCSSLCRVYVRSDSSFTMADTAFSGCPECMEFIKFVDGTNDLQFVEIPLDPNGGELDERTIRTVLGHNYGILPTPEREGFVFDGWWTAAEGGSEITSTMKVKERNPDTLYAHWKDQASVEFMTGGDAEWSQISDGVWESGRIGAGKVSWLQKAVAGKGSLSFEWMVSDRHDVFYMLDLYVDGEKRSSAGGSTKWVSVSCDVDSPGTHYFKWVFSMVGTLESDPNYGRVRNIKWTSRGELPEISDNATQSEVAATVNGIGFTDANVAKMIGGDAAKYRDFREWASIVEGGAASVVTSDWAAASYLLGVKKLFGKQPYIEISDYSILGAGAETGSGFSVTMHFFDGEENHEVSAESVAELFELSNDLRDWEGKFTISEKSEGMGASHTFTIVPNDLDATRVFLRIHASASDQ